MGACVSHLLLSALGVPGVPFCWEFFWRARVRPRSVRGPAFWPTQEDQAQGDIVQNSCVPSVPQRCDLNVDFGCLFWLTTRSVKGTLSGFLSGASCGFLVFKRQ